MRPNEKERKILAHGYDSEFYRVLRKQLERHQMELAQQAVNANEISQVHILRGGIIAIKWLDAELRSISKKEEAKNKSS